MEKAKSKPNVKLFAIIGAAAVAVIGIVVALILILGGNKSKLIGHWVYEGGSWEYNFIDDTKGEYGVGGLGTSKFDYKDNGDSITFQYEGSTVDMTLDYRIEGDKLIIMDSFGSETVYNRK